MNTKTITAFLLASCSAVMARPGDLDRSFDPELRAWVAPDHVSLAADGRAWIGGGFDRGDAYSTGDLLKLGENGGVESEPALGYLKRIEPLFAAQFFYSAVQIGYPQSPELALPFLLAGGGFLLKGESGGWLRVNAAGRVLGKAFPDRLPGETISPQFERDGKLWVIRQFANNERVLERRLSTSGTLDNSFTQAADLPRDVNTAVSGPDGSVWVLAGDASSWFYVYDLYGTPRPVQRVFQLDPAGNLIGTEKRFQVARTMNLVAGPAGAFRLVYGADQSMWNYWPSPTTSHYQIEWYSAAGVLERSQNFGLPLFGTFVWAEAPDGSFVATDAVTRFSEDSPYYFIGNVPTLRRFRSDGAFDTTFISPGLVRSVKALPCGKWLIDGLRRIHADGSEDTSWSVPQLSTPAWVNNLQALSDGRILAGGNFATADGLVRNRLAIFRANGSVDPSFILDERIEEWRSIAVSGQAIYVVTNRPVAYGNNVCSNLVKLRLDGSLDESYEPQLAQMLWWSGGPISSLISLGGADNFIPIPLNAGATLPIFPVARPLNIDNVYQVTALAGGDILVQTSRNGGDIWNYGVYRLKSNGTADSAFRGDQAYYAYVLALADGGYVSGGVIHRADGSVRHNLNTDNFWLSPICEATSGILFREGSSFSSGKLTLWTPRGFASWFQAPALDWGKPVAAVSGELGMIYLSATLENGNAGIHRLLPNGRLDRTFRAPDFTQRERQYQRRWWKAEESGKSAFNVARNEIATPPLAILWQPGSRRLWTGGNFNMVDGQPRDGLARIQGGFFWNR